MTLSAPSFKVGEVNAAYPTATFVASGGLLPYQWTVASGAIPMGLNLGSDGSLAGSPSTAGTYSFVIQVADSGDQTAKAAGSILVRPALSATLTSACATTCNVELGCANVCGAFGSVGGGVGPYSYSVISGSLPGGTSLDAHAMKLDGTFNGPVGTDQFTAMVTDGYGETATLSPYFQVAPHIAFPGGSMACPNTGCTSAGALNGSPPPKAFPWTPGVGTPSVVISGWTVTNGTCYPGPPPCPPPAKPTVAISGSNVVVTVPGPGMTWPRGYTATLTLKLTDQAPCAASTNCSVVGTVTVTVA